MLWSILQFIFWFFLWFMLLLYYEPCCDSCCYLYCDQRCDSCCCLYCDPCRDSCCCLRCDLCCDSCYYLYCGACCASPKPFFRAPWRLGDAMVGRGNAEWTTSKSGHAWPCKNGSQGPPAEKDWKSISAESSLVFLRRSNRPRDWTELNWIMVCSMSWFMLLFMLLLICDPCCDPCCAPCRYWYCDPCCDPCCYWYSDPRCDPCSDSCCDSCCDCGQLHLPWELLARVVLPMIRAAISPWRAKTKRHAVSEAQKEHIVQ